MLLLTHMILLGTLMSSSPEVSILEVSLYYLYSTTIVPTSTGYQDYMHEVFIIRWSSESERVMNEYVMSRVIME